MFSILKCILHRSPNKVNCRSPPCLHTLLGAMAHFFLPGQQLSHNMLVLRYIIQFLAFVKMLVSVCMEQGEEMYCIVHFTLLSIGAFVLCKMLISAVDCAKQGQLLLWTLSHHFVSCFEVVTNLLHLRHTIMPTFKRISSSLSSSSSSSQSSPS